MTECWCVWCTTCVPSLSVTKEREYMPWKSSFIPTGCCHTCHAMLAQMHFLAYSKEAQDAGH